MYAESIQPPTHYVADLTEAPEVVSKAECEDVGTALEGLPSNNHQSHLT